MTKGNDPAMISQHSVPWEDSMSKLMSAMIASALLIPTAAMAEAPSRDDKKYWEEVVCKRKLVTGSLIKGDRVCMTRSQWEFAAEVSRKYAQDIQTASGKNINN